MEQLILRRLNFNHPSNQQGVFGVLLRNGLPIACTCEDPWNQNKTLASCIPLGLYPVEKYSGTKYKNVWQVYQVPNRSAILIHWGNTIDNTAGCILVGQGYGQLNGKPSIINSVAKVEELRKLLPNKFNMLVVD